MEGLTACRYIEQSCIGLSGGHRRAEEWHSLQGVDGWHKVTVLALCVMSRGIVKSRLRCGVYCLANAADSTFRSQSCQHGAARGAVSHSQRCRLSHPPERAPMAAPCRAGSTCEPLRAERSAMRAQAVQSASRRSCRAGRSPRTTCTASTAPAPGTARTAQRESVLRALRSTIGTGVHVLVRRGWSSPATHRRAPAHGRARPMVSGQSLAQSTSPSLQVDPAWAGCLPSP